MLLSLGEDVYKKVLSGEKIYEHRKVFPDEHIKAYIYVSSPMKSICGIMYLSNKTSLLEWREKFKDDPKCIKRIDEYLPKHKFAMEINKFDKEEKFIEFEKNKEVKKIGLLEKNMESINFYKTEKNSESFKNFQSEKNYESKNFYESQKSKNFNKKFILKINTEDAAYDEKNICYYIRKKDLDFHLTNPSKIKSPDPIQILYYKNHVYKNQVEIMRKIIEKELGQ